MKNCSSARFILSDFERENKLQFKNM